MLGGDAHSEVAIMSSLGPPAPTPNGPSHSSGGLGKTALVEFGVSQALEGERCLSAGD